jgi:hypothetical protein
MSPKPDIGNRDFYRFHLQITSSALPAQLPIFNHEESRMKHYLYAFSIIAMMIAISGTFVSHGYASLGMTIRAKQAQVQAAAPDAPPNPAPLARSHHYTKLSEKIRAAAFAVALLGICGGFTSVWLARKEKRSNFWFIALLIIFVLANLFAI